MASHFWLLHHVQTSSSTGTNTARASSQQDDAETRRGFSGWYNLRKRHRGGSWSDRYHYTLVDDGTYAWNCMKYIDLNLVRAGLVHHPSEWRWCGYDELTGGRQRYRLLDLDSVLEWQAGMSRCPFIRD